MPLERAQMNANAFALVRAGAACHRCAALPCRRAGAHVRHGTAQPRLLAAESLAAVSPCLWRVECGHKKRALR